MSSNEETPMKAGHPAALKVGGVRIANRTRKNSEDAPPPKPAEENGEEEQDEEETVSKSPKPQIVMWGQVRDQHKDYPSQAVQHMQNKPMPTHEQTAKPMPAHVIQQPRK